MLTCSISRRASSGEMYTPDCVAHAGWSGSSSLCAFCAAPASLATSSGSRHGALLEPVDADEVVLALDARTPMPAFPG